MVAEIYLASINLEPFNFCNVRGTENSITIVSVHFSSFSFICVLALWTRSLCEIPRVSGLRDIDSCKIEAGKLNIFILQRTLPSHIHRLGDVYLPQVGEKVYTAHVSRSASA